MAILFGIVRDLVREVGKVRGRSCSFSSFRILCRSQPWTATRWPVPQKHGAVFPSPHLARTKLILQTLTVYVQAKGKMSAVMISLRGVGTLKSLEYWGWLLAILALDTTFSYARTDQLTRGSWGERSRVYSDGRITKSGLSMALLPCTGRLRMKKSTLSRVIHTSSPRQHFGKRETRPEGVTRTSLSVMLWQLQKEMLWKNVKKSQVLVGPCFISRISPGRSLKFQS